MADALDTAISIQAKMPPLQGPAEPAKATETPAERIARRAREYILKADAAAAQRAAEGKLEAYTAAEAATCHAAAEKLIAAYRAGGEWWKAGNEAAQRQKGKGQ